MLDFVYVKLPRCKGLIDLNVLKYTIRVDYKNAGKINSEVHLDLNIKFQKGYKDKRMNHLFLF